MGSYIHAADRVPGVHVTSYSALREFRNGSIVRTLQSPQPTFFVRSSRRGWQACTESGCTRVHARLRRELSGWPRELPFNEILLPVELVYMPPTVEELARSRSAPDMAA